MSERKIQDFEVGKVCFWFFQQKASMLGLKKNSFSLKLEEFFLENLMILKPFIIEYSSTYLSSRFLQYY